MSKAIGDVVAERILQRHPLGRAWTLEHDDEHTHGELAVAAATYAAPHLIQRKDTPWAIELKSDTRRNLVIAAALLIAEIERLDRCYARIKSPEQT